MALTSTERSQRLRSDPAKKAAENERHNLARREQRAVAAEERRVAAEQAREAAILDADKWRERTGDEWLHRSALALGLIKAEPVRVTVPVPAPRPARPARPGRTFLVNGLAPGEPGFQMNR